MTICLLVIINNVKVKVFIQLECVPIVGVPHMIQGSISIPTAVMEFFFLKGNIKNSSQNDVYK